MPLFEIGYRRYEGERTSHAMRWWPITRTGLTIAWRSKLLKRLVLVSFLPFLYFAWVFFVIGRITEPGADPSSPLYDVARKFMGDGIVAQLQDDPAVIRSAVWAVTFGYFGSFFQLWMVALVAAIAGPALVADDLRTRAFLIYFARPISRMDYIIGKCGVLVVLLATVTLLPSLVLCTLSILFSPSLDTMVQTLPVAGSIALASLGTIVPVSLVILALSSLTRRPRFAAVAWLVVCFFGPLAHTVLQQTRDLADNGWTFLLSLPHTIRTYQLGLYDVGGRTEMLAVDGDISQLVDFLTTSDSPLRAGIWLGVISITCVLILLRRVDSPTRI